MDTVKLSILPDGTCAAYAVAEITSVPYYELLHREREQAVELNQSFFTQYIANLLRVSEPDTTSYEIIFQSVPVSNQTYSAQVRMFFVIRKIGRDAEQIKSFVAETAAVFRNEMEQHHFTAEFLSDGPSYVAFMRSISNVSSSCAASVSRQERFANGAFGLQGLYYTPALIPTVSVNLTELTNPLTQYPGSAVSLQIIPTRFQDQERAVLTQTNAMLGMYFGEMRRMQGMMPLDAQTQAIADAFNYYTGAMNEPAAVCNFIIYSEPQSISALCSKVISVIENAAQSRGSALEIRYFAPNSISPAGDFHISPWTNRDRLLYHERDPQIWQSPAAPEPLRRLKYMMLLSELHTVFKFPIDDGTSIGLESQKVKANREKLSGSIISDSNFKMGVIRNGGNGTSFRQSHAGIPLNDFTKHGLIVGTPGSGKTNFSLGFLLRMWKEFHIPFIAVEPTKTEYRSLVDAIPDMQIFTPGKSDISPYIINPFIPPTNVTVESYVPSLMTAFKAAFSMPDPLPDIFRGAMNECYSEYGWRSNSTRDDPHAEPFGMYEFIRVFKRRIQSLNYKGDVKSNMESAGVVRLLSLIEQNPLIYDSIKTIPLEDMMKHPTVIELNAINNKEQKSLIMALLLIQICVYIKTNIAGDGKLKNILLIDEAHVLLGGGGASAEGAPDSQNTTIEAIEDMIAEVRAYGVSIIIADQSPAKVGKNIVANTFVKVMFRLVEKENKDIIRNATNMDDADYEMLGRLGVGEAMLHYGRVHEPLHIKTYKLSDLTDQLKTNRIRDVIPNEEIAALSHYWDTRPELLIPHAECVYNCECTERCDMQIRAEADYIATRLINQYRPTLNTVDDLLHLLSRLDAPINAIVQESAPDQAADIRLGNCAKIKFLRKVLLDKSFEITKKNYHKILSHKSFLKRSES